MVFQISMDVRLECVTESYSYIIFVYNIMFLDKFISYKTKVIIAVVCSGFWIFFRTADCYNLIPRLHLFPVLFVMLWTYLNYYEPLFLPIGLSILILYAKIHKGEQKTKTSCTK